MRRRESQAVPSYRGRLCAYCGDTIDTIGDPGQPGTVERRSRTGRRFRSDKAYCDSECLREAARTMRDIRRRSR